MNHMKRILLVTTSLNIGGIQTAYVNMANALSRSYEVDCFVYHPEGDLLDRLESTVRLLPTTWMLRALGMSFREAWESRKAQIIIFKLFSTAWAKIIDNRLPIEIALHFCPVLEDYDLAIAFSHEAGKHRVFTGCPRLVDQKVKAKQKISWIHYDPLGQDLDNRYNAQFYQKMDRVIAVSRSVMESCNRAFPALAPKLDYCYNFQDFSFLTKMSEEKQGTAFPSDGLICFSACRLAHEKGILRALEAFAPTLRQQKDIRWYIAGDGYERHEIEGKIKAESLEEYVVLLGNQLNPYPYMKNADLYLSVSYSEAAPVVYRESNYLGVPVFSTETCSSRELLGSDDGNFICGNSKQELEEAFSALMAHREKIKTAKEKIQRKQYNNNQAILKTKEWLSD